MAEKKDYYTELMKIVNKYGLVITDNSNEDYIHLDIPGITLDCDNFADIDKDDKELIYYKEISLRYNAESKECVLAFTEDEYNHVTSVSGLKKFESILKNMLKIKDVYLSLNKQLKSHIKKLNIEEDF